MTAQCYTSGLVESEEQDDRADCRAQGEFQPREPATVVTTLPVAAPELGTADPAPSSATPGTQLTEQASTAEVDNFPKIIALFEDEQYQEGLNLAKQEIAKEKDTRTALGNEAFYLHLAFMKGSNSAFGALEQHASAHPTNCDVLYWWGHSLARAGRLDDALQAWEAARANAANESERVRAALAMRGALSRLERSPEARAILRKELSRTNGPAERASLFVGLSNTYELGQGADLEKAFLMRELAVRSTPADSRLRFELAHDYAKHGAHELSFVHYRSLLQQNPDYGGAQNNAGVSAERLSLPLTSVEHYRTAQSAGETLASANLAYALIAAGFKDEATEILDEARRAKDVHRNVDRAVGQLAESEADEETKIEQISERVGKVRKWRIEHAEALLRATPPAEEVSTSYSGVPSPLELEMSNDGAVKGAFVFASGKAARLIGTIKNVGKWTEWHLTRNTPPIAALVTS